jgi:hypothetical protein
VTNSNDPHARRQLQNSIKVTKFNKQTQEDRGGSPSELQYDIEETSMRWDDEDIYNLVTARSRT